MTGYQRRRPQEIYADAGTSPGIGGPFGAAGSGAVA